MIIPETIPNRPLFKISDVASLFSVNSHTVYDWIYCGKINAEKYVGTIRIPHEAILEFINNGCGKIINEGKKFTSARILRSLRGRLGSIVKKNGQTKSDTTMKLLGCSLDDFLEHTEKQFKPGMTWENYGKWHIDHIIPCAQFDLSRPYHQRICFHYTNLQPLWAVENLIKSDTITRIAVAKYFINHKFA